jgi:hypothetical protein
MRSFYLQFSPDIRKGDFDESSHLTLTLLDMKDDIQPAYVSIFVIFHEVNVSLSSVCIAPNFSSKCLEAGLYTSVAVISIQNGCVNAQSTNDLRASLIYPLF